MKRLAYLFPGQGSQSAGMGKDFFANSAVARVVFEQVDQVAGRPLSALCFDGPEEELKRTINTQPAILAVSLAAYGALRSAGAPRPDFVAGHSLGEFTALAAAEVLPLDDVVKLVDKRARLMEECPKGAMSAVLNLAPEQLSDCCAAAVHELGAEAVCLIANYNTREQLVISGSPEAVNLAGAKAKAAGAKVIPLPVGGAFHSPLMSTAAREFEQELSSYSFKDAACPVVQNVDAKGATAAAELQSKLAAQMPSAVRWYETIEYMIEQGVDTFVEIGPGKALTGMVKRINKNATLLNVFDLATLNVAVEALKQQTASV